MFFQWIKTTLFAWIVNHFGWTEQNTAYQVLFVVLAFLCMVIPYLLGSINPAIVFSKKIYRDDVRTHGSGNAGSTNMLRTYGFKAALLTFVCDMLKAVISLYVGALLIGAYGVSIAGLFVVLGHMFPLYYKFKGGKGVACCAAVALMISPLTFLCVIGVFILVLIGSRMVSMASVMAALLYPLFMRAFDNPEKPFPLGVAMAVLEACFIVFMHRENLKRIWNYEERKVDFSKITDKFKKKKKTAEKDEENGGEGDA